MAISGFDWPVVDMSLVSQYWWNEVMQGTDKFDSWFDSNLPEAYVFTARSITHVILSKTRDEVLWFFEGSRHLPEIIKIYDLIWGNRQNEGMTQLMSLISSYFSAAREYLDKPD